MCHRVQGDSVAQRQPLLCVCWSRDVVCALRARVRDRASRTCVTENTYIFSHVSYTEHSVEENVGFCVGDLISSVTQ